MPTYEKYMRRAADSKAPEFLLTEREFQLVIAVVDGLSWKEMAAKHGCSRNAIHVHFNSIYDKLGFGKQAELVAWWYERGRDIRHKRLTDAIVLLRQDCDELLRHMEQGHRV